MMTEILIVDDDPAIGMLLGEKLSEPDRALHFAANGTEALALLQARDIDLVLLDLGLPDIDGRIVLDRMRENIRTADTPVFVLSALDDSAAKIQCFNLGIDTYFVKPFDLGVLRAAISSHLSRRRKSASESRKDALTGLANRAAFAEAYEQMKAMGQRTRTPLSIAIIDFDRFKLVNDTYGHSAGDEVLRRGTSIISNQLRDTDLIARWGGEEFVALLPNADAPSGAVALMKSLEALRATEFSSSSGQAFRVTFSAGVAEVKANATLDQAVSEADRYLYQAKTAGRNMVISDKDNVEVPKKKILLADDDKILATFVQHRLTKEGFDVVHFPNGRAALEAAPQANASLCILDVQMPEMDGFELLSNLKKLPVMAHVPMMLVTALGSDKSIARGLSLGADDYIVKPFSPLELVARVRRLLQ
ncbi:MAG: response regulator [Candidatus Hydrogenedentota bacterium]